MDLHKASDYDVKPTIEEIKRNHIADLETQAKYGVRFVQYWVNEDAGLVFCLMEAPDKESCIATHQEAHGNIACNVIELGGGDYKLFMGEANLNEFDIAIRRDGTMDTGSRSILATDIITLSDTPHPYKIFKTIVERFNGRDTSYDGGKIITVFDSSAQTIACARAMLKEFSKLKQAGVELRMGISSGEPVTDRESIFGNTLQLAEWLCDITMPGQISICAHTMALAKNIVSATDAAESGFKFLTPADERLLNSFMTTIEPVVFNEKTTLETLSKTVGISKAQLYRKITSLTGYAPNSYIQELRLRRALKLISEKFGNVAQIAFASGFNNPSYFTRSFQKRFGILPTKVLKSAN
jgi:AraC-like DNA-binding protein